jgi:hypothetical protein
MAVATLTPKEVNFEGVEAYSDTADYTAATAADGFQFVNDGKTIINIINADDGTCTATIDNPGTCNFGGTTVHDVDVDIPAADDFLIGPFPMHRFNDENGKVTISLVANTDVTAISACVYKLT